MLAYLALLLVPLAWGPILRQWRKGIYLLLLYLPFAGIVGTWLQPSVLPLLYKDIFFVIPTYMAFFLLWPVNRREVRVPVAVFGAGLALVTMVLFQVLNPSLANWLVAAIGVKVWLSYVPMILLGSTYVRRREDLIELLRAMNVVCWIPCLIGVAQWIGSMIYGYEAAMFASYGPAAKNVMIWAMEFDEGGMMYRIPSTFASVSQYGCYFFAMIVPTYAQMRADPSPRWRKFAGITFILVIMSFYLSGARSAFVFAPLLLFLIYFIDRGLKGLAPLVAMLVVPFLLAIGVSGMNIPILAAFILDLFLGYSQDIVYMGLVESIANAPLGLGTGMNTAPARYAFPDNLTPEAQGANIENYYAKAVRELSLFGLAIVVILFVSIVVHGYRSFKSLRDPGLKSSAAAFVAFSIAIPLVSFKGWILDIDPVNVYFWLFAGITFKLKYLEASRSGGEAA